MLQLEGNSSIAIRRRFQRGLLHLVAQFHLNRSVLPRDPPAVETGSAQTAHLTQRFHGFAFLGDLLDFFKQPSTPPPTAAGCSSLQTATALFKKSFSLS